MPLVRALEGHRMVTVHVEDRLFVVYFNDAGGAVRIVERKTVKRFSVDLVYNVIYWSAKHHAIGKKNTLPKQIIAAACATL